MDLRYIDYVSVSHRSWLHRIPAVVKMLMAALVIFTLLWFESLPLEIGITTALIIIAVSAGLPMKIFLPLVLYPILFLVIIFVSTEHLTLNAVLMLVFRVFAITAAIILLFLSTSYPAIFGILGRFLPGFIVAALFFSYRSIFIISDSIADIRIVMHLKGGIDWRHPISTMRNLGTATGHFLAHSIDSSQRIADGLTLRGFSNRIYYLGGRR
ncbi:MAG: energy-coupling factor transporter transmembrane component T family protein [Armatimonadota bacterium]